MSPIKKIHISAKGQGWICVEKPSGMSVHNDPGKDLLSILAFQLTNTLEKIGTKGIETKNLLQPVHRLDKDTSGLLLVALNPKALARLSDLFAKGMVKKRYLALVHGNFDIPSEEIGLWETPLSKEAGGRNNPAGKGKKVRAQTQYKVLKQSIHYALLEIELLTGRKHQIRRHAKICGHPVTGDRRYGSQRSVKFLNEVHKYQRLGLHAFRLEFQDLESKVVITSDQIPLEMETLLLQDL